jgi:hypothetical protein
MYRDSQTARRIRCPNSRQQQQFGRALSASAEDHMLRSNNSALAFVAYLHSNGATLFDDYSLHRAVHPNTQIVAVSVWLQIRSSSVYSHTVNNVAGHRTDTERAGIVLVWFLLVPTSQTGLGKR